MSRSCRPASWCVPTTNASSSATAASGFAASCSRHSPDGSCTGNDMKLVPASIPARLCAFKQKVARDADAAGSEQAPDLVDVLRGRAREQMREHRSEEHHVIGAARHRESERRRVDAACGVVGNAGQIRMVKAEVGMPRRDRVLTPVHRLTMDVEAVVRAGQIIREADCEIAYAAPDVEHAVLRAQAAADEFRSCSGGRARKRRRVAGAVVVLPQMPRRQETVARSAKQSITGARRLVDHVAESSGQTPQRCLHIHRIVTSDRRYRRFSARTANSCRRRP